MSKLHISSRLSLPDDAVTETLVVFGRKGMGKTNFGAVLAEELDRTGQRFVLIDPVGVSWGLQHGANGTSKGLDLLLLGGRRGDLPVLPTAGTVIADLVVDESVSVVVDISRDDQGKMWKRGERIRFMTAFATRFYERQGEQMRPVMLIIDEAARFVPQMAPKGAIDIAECMSAVEQIVEEGRNVGVGVCLITQRSARINKSVSELAGCMVAFQTVGPNSVGAIVDWLGEHVKKEKWSGFIEQVRELPRGHALIVSPGWLKFEGVVPIRLRHTFDSSATPKTAGRGVPKKLTRSDLRRYQERMAATLEEAKANDPRALRAENARLKTELHTANTFMTLQKPKTADPARAKAVRIKVPVLKDGQLARLEQAVGKWLKGIDLLVDVGKALGGRAYELQGVLAKVRANGAVAPTSSLPGRRVPLAAPASRPVTQIHRTDGDVKLGLAQRKILTVLAQYPEGRTVTQLALLTGYAVGGGAFRNPMSALRTRQFIEGSGQIRLTPDGETALGRWEPLPEPGAALLDYWMHRLGHAEREILRVLADAYPRSLAVQDVASRTQSSKGDAYASDGGAFRNPMSRLRTLELVEGRGDVRLSKILIERVPA